VNVITKKNIEDQNALILSDALKNISGINVQSNLGTRDYFIIRGFESSTSGLIQTDGINEPDVSLFRFFGYGVYDLYNIEQIEVLKGPGSFLYGGNTLSGTVNLVRKQPLSQNFLQISAMYGKYNHYRTLVDLNISDSQHNKALRFNAFWQNFEHFRDGKRGSTIAMNPVIQWKFNQNQSISLNIEYLRSKQVPDTGIPLFIPEDNWQLPEVSTSLSYQTPFDAINQELIRSRVQFQWRLSNILSIRNTFFHTYLEGSARVTMTHVPHRVLSGNWVIERHMFSFTEFQNSLGNQLEIRINFKLSQFNNNLLIGFDLNKLDIDSDRALSMIPQTLFYQPITEASCFEELSTLTKIETNASNLLIAPYLVSNIKFSDSFGLFAGGRLDFITYNTDRQNAPFDYILKDLTSKSDPLEQWHEKFSPILGLIFKDSEQLRFYFNYSKSFGQGLRVIDIPEESEQFEFGYKFVSASGAIKNSVSIYQLVKRNMTIPITGPLQGDKQQQIGSQRSRGIEIELITNFFPEWYTFLNYTYIEADLLKYRSLNVDKYVKRTLEEFSGNKPAFVPAQMINFWTVFEFINGLGIGLGLNHVSNQFVHVDNDYEIDEYFAFNSFIFLKTITSSWQINFRNLSNVQYYSRGFGPYSIIPNDLFSVQVTVSFTL
jgi:iron complex outermembrane receptor protein